MTDKPRPQLARWVLLWVGLHWPLTGVVVCLFLWAFLFLFDCFFGGSNTKYGNPSRSSRGAKWRRLFICNVELEQLEPSDPKAFFKPQEAWLEKVYENYKL